MGTKHGYTEKECKVCHVVKPRDAFPKFGGLTCTVCWNIEQKKRYPKRYEHEKRNPKYVEANRRRAREYKRRKRIEKRIALLGEGTLTPQELSLQLEGLAGELPSGVAEGIAQQMEQLKQVISNALGAESPGAQEINGAANNVITAISSVSAAIEQLRGSLTSVAGRAGQV